MATARPREDPPPDWLLRVSQALDDTLLEVWYLPREEGVDFLVVHAPGAVMPALRRFLGALREAADMPPFQLAIVEQGRPDWRNFDEYQPVPRAAVA